MSWIEIGADQRKEFIRIEREWLETLPVNCSLARHIPKADGDVAINVPIIFTQHLRGIGFRFKETEPSVTTRASEAAFTPSGLPSADKSSPD